MSSSETARAEREIGATDVDDLLREHFATGFTEEKRASLRKLFRDEHVVALRNLCPKGLLEEVRAEAAGIMDRFGVVHDFDMEITDGTPRHMASVGQPVIKDNGPLIHSVYFSPTLRSLLADIVGEELFICPYPGEHYVISRLARDGDTHGWHWDDYTYGFILVLEAPDHRDGGFVQAVPHTSWDKENPDVHGALLKSVVRSYAFEAGDAYLIKTDTTMHRVYPIRGDGRRLIVNTTFANGHDLVRPMSHETNDTLFGGAAADPAARRS
ncbi:hypothetical protein [Actinomadura sp. DC4]|uniref:HalD/BesD family halogenase n=1 Tax=Actinomadura sp. DC4 TaxID=3055069 RepID=UPI0025B22614|nr:hypothetical protein [Actinomadura sp. DC4]MDN3354837.1 hypothetical protein [Actinomadura sp. DC4]